MLKSDDKNIQTMVAAGKEHVAEMKPHVLPFLVIVTVVVGAYLLSLYVEPGWCTYFLSSLALAVIAFTSLARIDGIGRDKTSLRWQLRRGGLLMVGLGCIGLIVDPLITHAVAYTNAGFPTWKEVILRGGIAITILTGQESAWIKYLSHGKERHA